MENEDVPQPGSEGREEVAEEQPHEAKKAVEKDKSAGASELATLLGAKWEDLEEEALELFKALLRVDTQNFGEEGTEMKAVAILQAKFDAAGVTYEVVEPKPGRGNIVARVTGRESGKGAVLLSAHLDTVHAPKENWEEEGWKHDPFGAEVDEEDGCVYGRGALDMKHMAAFSATLLCFIQRAHVVLSRDLIFAGLADEERSGSAYGVKYLVENRPELIEADVVFNELGAFSLFFDGKEGFPIQIAEKGSCALRLTVRGEGGHSSVYNHNNPIAKLGAIAHKIATVRLPVRINDYNRMSIESIARMLSFPKSTIIRRLTSPFFTDIILDSLFTEEQVNIFGPILRNTANPTIIGGGDMANQIPSMAWMTIDGRILPGCTFDDIIEDIKQLIGASRFEPSQDPNGRDLPPEMTLEIMVSRGSAGEDLSSLMFREVLDVLKEVIAKHANGAPIVPMIVPGSTDSYHYGRNPRRQPVCLGFSPLRFPEGMKFSKLFHGLNERVPVEGFKWGLHVLADAVFKLCDGELSCM